jgi:hypothetical protein
MAGEIGDTRVEGCEARIAGLSLHKPRVNLLNHHRDLEHREDLIVTDTGDVAAGLGGVSIDDFAGREIARSIGQVVSASR